MNTPTSNGPLEVDDGMPTLPVRERFGSEISPGKIRKPHFLQRYVKMQYAESDITQLARDIWQSVLGLEMVPQIDTVESIADDRLSGSIHIAGAWKGSVTLDAPRPFGRRAAATMFNLPEADVSENDIVDALAELTNMLGGNIKSILPGPSFLALPTVTEGIDYNVSIPDARRMSDLTFQCGESPVRIQLFEQDETAKTPRTGQIS